MSVKIDDYSKIIMKELVKNTRISDNQISKNTKVPLKTVNRKRKDMEQKGIINYFTMINNGSSGTGEFGSTQIYIVTFRYGIHRKQFMDKFPDLNNKSLHFKKHIQSSFLCEKDGNLIVFFVLESRNQMDIMEIFNVDILGLFKHNFGENCVEKVDVFTVSTPLRFHHNYLIDPKSGQIDKSLTDSEIFVT